MVLAEKWKDLLPAPNYFSAKGMTRDQDWVESYFSMILQWPETCSISLKDRHLVGLAKSVAFNWEPGILNHTDLALRTGSKPEQIAEVLKATAATLGLAELDKATQAMVAVKLSQLARLELCIRKSLEPVKAYYLTVPCCFRRKIVIEDSRWFVDLLTVAKPAYDLSSDVLEPRVRSLVCLAAAGVVGWQDGIKLYGAAARRFGATVKDAADVIKSVFKTTVSNAMAAGFRTPCHIPDLDNYQTILRAYVGKGALAEKRSSDPLTGTDE